MKVIVGLGNPTEKYKNTRHNVGFILLDKVAEQKNLTWEFEKKFNALICKDTAGTFGDYRGPILYVKPQTYMNLSGDSVSKILNYFNLTSEDLIIVHDDVDLPFGKTKKAVGAGHAGHNGVKDIIAKLGTKDFERLRFGVGRPENNQFEVGDYVLSKFTSEEMRFLEDFEL